MKTSKLLNERKKENSKEVVSPVIIKLDRNEIIPHYEDECWSIDLIDQSSLAKYNKT